MSNAKCFAVRAICLALVLNVASCTPFTADPVPGPDKQAVGTFSGAMAGAGAGAVTGAQLSAATGPGALIGAGMGAAFGAISGLGQDLLEEDQLRRADEEQCLRERLWVQEVLAEHYARRLALHPSRDIFPADLFFDGDSTKLRKEAVPLAHGLAHMTQQRMPWSRIVVAAYAVSGSSESSYAEFLTHRRAEELANEFVRAGMEARRLQIQAVTLREPILIDPNDSPQRYNQAVEIIALDY